MINGEHTSNLVNDTIKSMLENTCDFMFVKDSNYVYVGSSEAFAVDCVGTYGVEDVLGKTDYELFADSQYADKYRKDDEALLLNGKARIEYREPYPSKDGQARYCLTTKILIRDEQGNPAGIFGQCRDITEQVRLEQSDDAKQKLLVHNDKIFTAMQNVYDVVLYFDFEIDYYHHVVGAKYATDIIKPSGSLSEVIPAWLNNDMTAETKEANKKFFDLSTLQERMTEDGILTRELQSTKFGWIRISLLPVDSDEQGKVISCLWVCEMIGEEIETRARLQNRIEILEALRNVYDICMYWNLVEDSYFRVYGIEDDVRGVVPDEGSIREILPIYLIDDLTPENLKLCEAFYDLDTLSQRLTANGTQTMEIDTIHSGWMRTSLVPAGFDDKGNVITCLWVGEIIEDEKKKEIAYNKAIEEVTYIAQTDTLTGLLNRGGSEARMVSAIDEKTPGLLCMMDINDFKHINDRYGHVAGDFVLQKLAECMRNVFGEGAVLARYGGDELVVFSPEITSLEDAQSTLNGFVSEVEGEEHEKIGGEHIHVSMGAFVYDGRAQIRFEDIYAKCDAAMYYCKEQTDIAYLLLDVSGSKVYGKRTHAYSKRSLEGLFNNVPGGVVMYEWDGKRMKTLYVSKFYEEQYGYGLFGEKKSAQGTLDYSHFHPDDMQAFIKSVSDAISGTHSLQHVCRVWNEKSDKYDWIEINAVSNSQPDGTALIYALFSNVTAQKEAELRLEKSRASLNAALGASNQLCYEYDPLTHTGECYTDENFFDLPKRIENYPDSLRDINLFHPDDTEKFIKTAHRMDDGEKKAQCDVRIRKGTEYRWYSCMFDAYYDLTKERSIAILTVVDIMDRMTAIQDYNDRVNRLEFAKNESLSAGYFNLNKDTYDCICIEEELEPYMTAGIGFEELMMNTSKAVIGEKTRRRYRELFSCENMMKMAEHGEMKVQLEYLFRLNEQHTQWLETVADMVKNPITGEVGGVVYSRSIQKERLSSLILKKTMDRYYPEIAVVVAETDEYCLFNYVSGSYEEAHHDFWNNLYKDLSRLTVNMTETQLKTHIDREIVLKHLAENEEFSFVFESNRKGKPSRAEFKCTYLEDAPDLILVYIRDITDYSLIEKLRHESEHDSLTGVYNRRKFLMECERMLREHPDDNFAMLHVDMKNFHRYNTFFGAEAGDRLLCDAASIITQMSVDYPYELYGRIDADVFCAFVPFNQEVYEKHMREMSQILANYRSDYLIEIKCGLYFVTDRQMPIDAMVTRAAIAASKVTPNSRLATVVYDASMEKELKDEQMIVNEMQNALNQGQFEFYLQPKYETVTRRAVGAEALVRWMHPQKGIIAPGRFIPVFEKNGFIANLDRYVWEQVCRLIRRWMDEGRKVIPISVNVSRISILGPNTVTFLKDLVRKYGIDPENLELELTESAYIENLDEIRPRLLDLQEFGFKVFMDDFGSGYSSLNTLKDLPVDSLKLDMKFLSATENGMRGKLLLFSIVRMSKMLGLPVIAEGVESDAQRKYLRNIGCEYMQGYLLAHPMSVTDYEKDILGDIK